MRIILIIMLTIVSSGCSNQESKDQVKSEEETFASIQVMKVDSKKEKQNQRHVVRAGRSNIALSQSKPDEQMPLKAASLNDLLAMVKEGKLISAAHPANFTTNLADAENRENYLPINENDIKLTSKDPVSTFSIDVDTAAYSNIRRMIMVGGQLPPQEAVKIEEMINYFTYDYQTPSNQQQPFSVVTEIAPTPWNPGSQLLQIGLKGFEPKLAKRPQANLVFLVDVSGSMQSANKLPLVKKSLRLLVNKMNEQDNIALVVYAGAAGLVLESTPAYQKSKIMAAINSLQSGGSTNGGDGIRLAYAIAEQHMIKDGINRVLIASDGDMNVGTTSLAALKALIKEKRELGISLTTLGYGTGNYNYALMEQLADVGNGNAAYIDSLREAQKVLVEEMQSTLLTIAKDVKIQIEFNPAVVAEYRLIGYENRILNRQDFKNDKIDAGEIGAGHTVTALYELVMVGSKAALISPLRYEKQTVLTESKPVTTDLHNEIGFIKLRYKRPGTNKSIEVSTRVQIEENRKDFSSASNNFQFASAVAGFGQLLRGGTYTQDMNYEQVLDIARAARGEDPHGYRSEFISLVELAESLSTPLKDYVTSRDQ